MSRKQPVHVTEDDLRWWLSKVDDLPWIEAVTYADSAPHSYIVWGRTPGMSLEDFERAGRVIETFGKPGRFYNRVNIYLSDGTRKWWIMPEWDKDMTHNSTLINMADAADTYGDQTVPDISSQHSTLYDDIGPDYDAAWLRESDIAENEEVRRRLSGFFGAHAPTTLDVGCGTGQLLDLGIPSVHTYTGVDPSEGMLKRLLCKHPKVSRLYPYTAREYLDNVQPEAGSFELVASIFASPSYMTPDELKDLVSLASRLVIFMNYDGITLPFYYNENRPGPSTAEASRQTCRELARKYGGEIFAIGDFETMWLEV